MGQVTLGAPGGGGGAGGGGLGAGVVAPLEMGLCRLGGCRASTDTVAADQQGWHQGKEGGEG